ncbi:hypothetical protein [Streptomyces sp. KMM 9044]|uniref:hypothetical protein n=1 Tax=Streptomyces sp. KMM 9044 TaxID=2744474 RepID=UPI002172772C|nr:hypothetical protein [Streptomyces sp. KMM 9044]WAX77426.1 hypothetical protein HUV60_006880 [Streptomyces sp. KMM 9044]
MASGRDVAALKLVPGTNATVVAPDPARTTWVRVPWVVTVLRSCGTGHASRRARHQRRMNSLPAVLR